MRRWHWNKIHTQSGKKPLHFESIYNKILRYGVHTSLFPFCRIFFSSYFVSSYPPPSSRITKMPVYGSDSFINQGPVLPFPPLRHYTSPLPHDGWHTASYDLSEPLLIKEVFCNNITVKQSRTWVCMRHYKILTFTESQATHKVWKWKCAVLESRCSPSLHRCFSLFCSLVCRRFFFFYLFLWDAPR